MRRMQRRRRAEFSPQLDGLEGRVLMDAAAARPVRPDAAAPYEFLNHVGKLTRTHGVSYGFAVHSASTITVEVSRLPPADRVRLESSATLATLAQQRGGANFSIVLQPGNYFVHIQGRKHARFTIDLYSAALATTTPSPGSSGHAGSPSGGSPPSGQGGSPSGGSPSSGQGGSPSGGSPSSPILGTYRGEATTQIIQINPLTGLATGSDTYQQATTMVLGARAGDGEGHYENNPFNMLIYPTYNAATPAGGDLFLDSGAVAVTYLGPLIVRYWTLQVGNDGFSGILSDNQTDKAVAANSVFGWAYLMPNEPQMGIDLDSYTFQDESQGAQYETTLVATFTGSNTIDIKIHGVGIASGSEAVINIDFAATRAS